LTIPPCEEELWQRPSELDVALVFFYAYQQVFPERNRVMQLRKSMQIINGRLRGRHDIDAAQKKHHGKNAEAEDNFFLHQDFKYLNNL
jgi:hypothetical protein